MKYPLESLLDLRRKTEEETARTLAVAIRAAADAETTQRQLDSGAEAANEQAREDRRRRHLDGAVLAADAQVAERYLAHLDAEALRLKRNADQHRAGPLAAAGAAESEARRRYLEARREREVLDQHRAGVAKKADQIRERRNEDEASDLALAAHLRRDDNAH